MATYHEKLAEYDRLPQPLEERVIVTKSELLHQIELRKQDILNIVSNSNRHTTHYYLTLQNLLEQFEMRVKKTVLPNRLEDWWRYAFEISHKGIALYVEHIRSVWVDDNETDYMNETVDQIFVLAFTKARMLTVDEYAKKYEIEPVTVRQWIRRCKLRAVEKAGKEWRISELADVPKRGFEGAQYRWWDELTDLPENLKYLEGVRLATVLKHPDSDNYIVILSDASGPQSKRQDYEMSANERESLESFLIGNPQVEYAVDTQTYNKIKRENPTTFEVDDDLDSAK